MHQDEQEAESTAQDDTSMEPIAGGADKELPIDPSINAGREAFGNVSDFGVQMDVSDAEDEAAQPDSI